MARRPAPPSYANMALAPLAPSEVASDPQADHSVLPSAPPKQAGRTLKEASAHLMLYLHPDAAKALKRYAVDQNAKVHDLLTEAVEDWFRRHGLRERVRAETVRTRAQEENGAN